MPDIGQLAPDFALPNQAGRVVRLSDLRGQAVVLFSFPKANTMGCNNQACGFRDSFPQIQVRDAVVLGISTDSVDTLARWQARQQLPYDLLSDPEHKVLSEWEAWGLRMLFFKLPVAATRSYWVIDAQGRVFDKQVGVGPLESVGKALAALERLTKSAASSAEAKGGLA